MTRNPFHWHPFSALEVCAQLGGQGLEPFYSLIEGGREGEFFAELEEYFYYALLKRCVCVCVEHRGERAIPAKSVLECLYMAHQLDA